MFNSGIPWTVAPQAPLSMGFPRKEYWSGLPTPFPGDLHNPGVKPICPVLQADSLPLSHQGSIEEVCFCFFSWWFVFYYGRIEWKLFFLPYICNGVLLSSTKEWTTNPQKAWLNPTCMLLSERTQSEETAWSMTSFMRSGLSLWVLLFPGSQREQAPGGRGADMWSSAADKKFKVQ